MKTADDTKTLDLLPNHDLAGEVPAQPNKARERAKRFRERNGVKPLTVNIDAGTFDGFTEWMAKNGKGRSKSAVIQRLIETQLLRKR
jgi:hypothetical protein